MDAKTSKAERENTALNPEREVEMTKLIVGSKCNAPSKSVLKVAKEFVERFSPYECENGIPLLVFCDNESQAFYVVCHLPGNVIVSKSDIDATLDPDESEDYKLNREIYTDNYAYRKMTIDASQGRSFEDLVVEYDTSYRPQKPLKVFGGQHRIRAISENLKRSGDTVHGLRAYFGLSVDQRYDIATANNTSIAISNDLLDRMHEELLGPELRDWCQSVGLLDRGQNFADRRSPEGIPTARIARTIVINFYLGQKAQGTAPIVCSSGPMLDKDYERLRSEIDWKDKALATLGQQFTILHKLQRDRVLNRTTDKSIEFANKAMHPSVTAAWAFAAGAFQTNKKYLQAHYDIVKSVSAPNDPLNAKAMLNAKLKGVDKDTYRGLGSRISGDEMGRVLELFIIQATEATKPGISAKLAQAAIQSYEAKKAKRRADQLKKGI